MRSVTENSSQELEDEDGSKPAKRYESEKKSKHELNEDERKFLDAMRMLLLMGKAYKFAEVFPQYHIYLEDINL